MENYTFDEFKKILDDGYQVYFTYLKNRFLLFKTNENCYTQKLIAVRTTKSASKDVYGNKKIYRGDLSIYGGHGIQVWKIMKNTCNL